MIQIASRKQGGVWLALALNEKMEMTACSFSEHSRRKAETAVLESLSPRNRSECKRTTLGSAKFKVLYDLYLGRRNVKLSSLDLSDVSPFGKRVYSQLCRIPRGRVTTYGAIAKKLGSRRYARAVGTLNANNPLPLVIPCHRVVLSTLEVGNYGMPGREPSEGSHVKMELLRREGVKFRDSKISKECVWSPEMRRPQLFRGS